MLNIQKILLPVVLTDTFRHVIQQAACLARRFHAEVILLHVVPPLSYPAGVLESGHEITARDLHAHIVQRAEKDLDQALRPELDGIAVTRVLLRGDPAREIVKTARDHDVDLIMMSTHGLGAFYRFLLGSVTAKVLHESHCPVWTGAHLEEVPTHEFSIRHVVCSVDLSPHAAAPRRWPQRWPWLPRQRLRSSTSRPVSRSGVPADPMSTPLWKEMIVGSATKGIAQLQQDLGTKAEVDSGNVPELLNRAAEQARADVMVVGRSPGRNHLGDNGEGYGIIRESHLPVLSV
jgi:nucleotide-binding universal stress UspA family protein